MSKTIFTGNHKKLIDVLIEARKKAGLKQSELGERLGKDQTFVSLVERYQRRIDVVEFYEYALALGEKPERLFSKFIALVVS
ncbi:MAG: helix-turn-helix transcriptional regulator [Caulobacterales bacterium]|nr:helix-turn-helix transcriptional regulator [Caulobacterales bacterium]MCA0373722.1 helix-turn-helix domain-containing protein [Pseudomonadota bacterium]